MTKEKKVAYTPLTEEQKAKERLKLIKNLKDPFHPAGEYMSPGAPRWKVEGKSKKEIDKLLAKKLKERDKKKSKKKSTTT